MASPVIVANTTAAQPITFVPNLKVNWTASDMCAYLQFIPDAFATGPGGDAWNTTFPGETPGPGAVGRGSSYHYTTPQAPQPFGSNGSDVVGLLSPFIGTGITFDGVYATKYGSSPPIFKVDSSLPQDAASSAGGPLNVGDFSLPWGTHVGVLTTVNGLLQVTSVTWELGIYTDATRFEDVPYFVMPFVVNGTAANPGVTLGNGAYNTTFWKVEDSIGDPPTPFAYLLGANMDNVLFNVPANTTLMTVAGLMGPEFGWGTFMLDPLPPGWPAATNLGIDQFYATNSWIHDSVLFLVTLDPRVRYQCLVQAAGASSPDGLGLSNVTFYSSTQQPDWSGLVGTSSLDKPPPAPPAPAPTPARTPTSVIVGAVIGAVGGVLLVAAAVAWYVRRMNRQLRRPGPAGPGQLDLLDEGASDTHEAGYALSPLVLDADRETPDYSKGRPRRRHMSNVSSDFLSVDYGSRRLSQTPIVQAADGGRFVHVVPPQYDPRWRESIASDSSDATGAAHPTVPRLVDPVEPPRKSVARRSVSEATTEVQMRDVPMSAVSQCSGETTEVARPAQPTLHLHNANDPRRLSVSPPPLSPVVSFGRGLDDKA